MTLKYLSKVHIPAFIDQISKKYLTKERKLKMKWNYYGSNGNNYKAIYRLNITNNKETCNLYIHPSPNNNCQVASLGDVATLISRFGENPKYMKNILRNIHSQFYKSMYIIDIRDYDFDYVYKVLKPFTTQWDMVEYKSSNGNILTLCMIKLNINKIHKK